MLKLQDFIPGVDPIPKRNVIDFIPNKCGELLCEFLIDANCCMLNGRNCIKACIKPQGISVVDYCIIPYKDLNKYAEFTVSTVSELITDKNGQSEFAAISIPDHSVLSWKVDVGVYARTSSYSGIKTTYTVYEKQITDNFLEGQKFNNL